APCVVFDDVDLDVAVKGTFIREYTGKVDELIKDKIKALEEVKAKEKRRKKWLHNRICTPSCSLLKNERSHARDGRTSFHGFCSTTTHVPYGDASNGYLLKYIVMVS
ncbi:hypothetical protein Drorol1_Dr00026989, partial [Drosera rotundifolia]